MKPTGSRKWQSSEGYRYLAPWSNAVLLRFLVRKITAGLPKSEHRMKAQVDDAARSVVANIEEGFKRDSTQDYLKFLSFSQGSLEEVKGDVRRLRQDGFLPSKPKSCLADLGIKLREFKGKLEEDKGNSPLELLYPPLKSLKGADLTFEMMLELCNKTDWLLRRLVESLEDTVTKEDAMSPMERWRWRQMEKERKRQKELDQQLKEIMEGKRKELD